MTSLLRVVLLALACASLLAQGSLTPSGPPAPTMRKLDQIEAPTPLGTIGGNSSTLTISAPGSYVLMGNVTVSSGDGIVIAAEDVTLDLNGFTVSSTAASATGAGVLISSSTPGRHRDVLVKNGFIRGGTVFSAGSFSGPGLADGVRVSNDSPGDDNANLRVSDIIVTGVAQRGIDVVGTGLGSPNLVVVHCQVRTAGATGIYATRISDCLADECGFSAINATIAERCTGKSVGASASAIQASVATDCHGTASGAGGRGVVVSTIATGCHGYSFFDGTGLTAGTAIHCFGSSGSGPFGMLVTGTASFCRGIRVGGVAISAGIAVACTSASGTIDSPSKQLGTP